MTVGKKPRLIVSALLLGWLACRTNWTQVGQAFAELRIAWWLAALVLYLGTQLVSALRWQMLARPLGFGRGLWAYVRFYFIGMFFNLFLPTSVGGDVVRAWYLDGQSGRRLAAFLSAFVERLSGLLVLRALACAATVLCPVALPAWIGASVWGVTACAVVGLMILPVAARRLARLERLGRLVRGVQSYVHEPRLLVITTILSLVVQATNVIVLWLVGRAIQAPVPAGYYWITVPMVTLLTLVPVSLNGMGVREGGLILFLAPVGVDTATALSLAFLWFAIFTAASIVGGAIYLLGSLPAPGEQSDDEPVGDHSDQGRARQPKAAA